MVRAGYRSRLTVEQGKIYWREVGCGPALVFLHSGWADGTQWKAVVSELSQHYRCYIPDLPGFGDSMLWSEQAVAISTLVESFTQYAEALNIRRMSLVGNGLGGWVAAHYALRFPYAVHRLMLLEPEGVSLPNQRWFCRWGQRLSIQTSVWAGLLETCAPLGELPGPLRDIKTLLQLRRQMMASPLSGTLLYARPLKQMSAELLDDSLQRLMVPTLIMGRRDAEARKQVLAERYAALCPMARVALLPAKDETRQAQILAQHIRGFVETEEPLQLSQRTAADAQGILRETAPKTTPAITPETASDHALETIPETALGAESDTAPRAKFKAEPEPAAIAPSAPAEPLQDPKTPAPQPPAVGSCDRSDALPAAAQLRP